VRPGRAADRSPPSSAAVMEEKSYTSTHPLGHTGPVTGSLYFLYYVSIQEYDRTYRSLKLQEFKVMTTVGSLSAQTKWYVKQPLYRPIRGP
jgi:hypothetical protein